MAQKVLLGHGRHRALVPTKVNQIQIKRESRAFNQKIKRDQQMRIASLYESNLALALTLFFAM